MIIRRIAGATQALERIETSGVLDSILEKSLSPTMSHEVHHGILKCKGMRHITFQHQA